MSFNVITPSACYWSFTILDNQELIRLKLEQSKVRYAVWNLQHNGYRTVITGYVQFYSRRTGSRVCEFLGSGSYVEIGRKAPLWYFERVLRLGPPSFTAVTEIGSPNLAEENDNFTYGYPCAIV